MNERVWQLQGQAKVLAEQHIAHRKFDDVMEYKQVLYDTTMNKFAELIVRECARVANDSNQSKNRAAGQSVGDVVREHFGVE